MTSPNEDTDVTVWDEGDEDVESLIGEDLSDAEIRSSFDDGDEDESETDESKFEPLSDAELEGDVDPALRGASWHLAPSLVRLRAEINKRWPKRDKTSDGSIGDASHSSRSSDHNPNGRRSVNAIDTDKDGISPATLVAAAKKHPAVNYVIWNRVIYSRSRGFAGKRYTGVNPHNKHIHVSILQSSSAEKSTRGWGIATATATAVKPYVYPTGVPAFPGLLVSGSKSNAVHTAQRRMNIINVLPKINEDGAFGANTVRNVKAFQKRAGITQDGKIGAVTWKMLWDPKNVRK